MVLASHPMQPTRASRPRTPASKLNSRSQLVGCGMISSPIQARTAAPKPGARTRFRNRSCSPASMNPSLIGMGRVGSYSYRGLRYLYPNEIV